MSEKETPESVEEQVQEEVVEASGKEEAVEADREVEASEKEEVIEEVETKEAEASEEQAQETAPEAPREKKGLMERRPSFAQSSVPNAHRGYSETPPVIMLLIVSVFVLLSIIFAVAAVVN